MERLGPRADQLVMQAAIYLREKTTIRKSMTVFFNEGKPDEG